MRKGVRHRGMLAVALLGTLPLLGLSRAGAAEDPSAEERVPDDKRVELLRFLADRNEVNYRKIKTWQVTYQFVDRYQHTLRPVVSPPPAGAAAGSAAVPKPEPQEVIVVRHGVVDLALDVAGDRFWVHYQEDGSKTQFESLDGKKTFKPGEWYTPITRTAIVTADSITDLTDIRKGPLRDFPDDPFWVGWQSGRVAERKDHPSHMRQNQLNELIDPRHFYTPSGARLYFEELNTYADGLEGKYGAEVAARLGRDITIIKRGNMGEKEYIFSVYLTGSHMPPGHERAQWVERFSERAGFLPVEMTTYVPLGKVCTHRVWVYQDVQGIFIPKEYHLTHRPEMGGNRLVLDRHLVLVKSKLNAPLPEGIFSPEEGLPLARGDRFADRIDQRLFVHDGSQLVAASQYNPATGQQQIWGRAYLVWGGTGALAVAGAWFAWRRMRRKAA